MPDVPLRYQAMVFELEGVLIDTAPQRCSALQRALSVEGLRLPAHDLRAVARGTSTAGAIGELRERFPRLDDTALDLIALRAEREFDSAMAAGMSLAPGALSLLEKLAGRVRMGIVTRLKRRQTTSIIELAELEPMFEVIVTAEDAEAKPASAPYEEALARLGRRAPLQRRRVLAVEDSVAGIMSAAGAHLACVAVGSIPAHEALQACGFVPSLVGVTPEELERVASSRDAEASL